MYSLGVVLNELVTGRVPFQAKTFGKLVAQIERDPPPLPSASNPEVDLALDALILTALSKAPEERFATAGTFADALDAYLRGERAALVARHGGAVIQALERTGPYVPAKGRPRAPRPPRLAVALGAGLLAVLAGVFYVQTDRGDLAIELSDPKAKVDVRVNGQEVTLGSSPTSAPPAGG